jgi:hypothetical protein
MRPGSRSPTPTPTTPSPPQTKRYPCRGRELLQPPRLYLARRLTRNGHPTTLPGRPYRKERPPLLRQYKYADIIGKPIVLDDTIQCTITGIVKDLPGNTDFYFGTFLSRPTYYTSPPETRKFRSMGLDVNSADQLFVRLIPGVKTRGHRSPTHKAPIANENPIPATMPRRPPAFNPSPISTSISTTASSTKAARPINRPSTTCWP